MFKPFLRKKLILIIISLLLIIFVWQIYKKYHAKPAPAPEAIMVEVGHVKQGEIAIQSNTIGTLTAAQSVTLAAEMSGQVAMIMARDGTFVRKGTAIIKLDDTVSKVKAESAKANYQYSEMNYNRMTILGKKGAISQQMIDQSLAELKEKKALAEESSVLASKMTITAPFDGVLGKIKVNPGEYVRIGEDIVTLTDTKNLRVEFSISEQFLGQLKLGQQVTLTTSSYPGKKFYGKVAYIAPTINTEDRTISVYADVPNDEGLLTAGLFVNVTQLMGSKNNVLLIPAISLVATIDGQQVYKIVNNKAVASPVKVGQRTENQVQILEGLILDDTVVVTGQHKLKDGTPVKYKL